MRVKKGTWLNHEVVGELRKGERVEEIRIELGSVQNTAGQISSGLTFLLVLRGGVRLKHSDRARDRTLRENDLEVINHNDFYALEGISSNVMLCVRPTRECLQRLCPRVLQCRFDCGNSDDTAAESWRQLLRHRLTLMTMLHFRRGGEDQLLQMAELLQVLYTLLHHFQTSCKADDKRISTRLEPILDMMALRYRESLGLEQTARAYYISNSYLARLFRRELGMTFMDYLTQLRLGSVRSDLICTDDSVAHIAMENGFSCAQALSRAFKKSFGLSPSEYRKQIRPEGAGNGTAGWSQFDLDGSLNMLARYLDRYEQKNVGRIGPRSIPMAGKTTSLCLPARIVDVGDLYRLLREDTRAQILLAQREIGFSYIRFSGLFVPRSGMEIFKQLDKRELIGLFLECGLYPLVQVEATQEANDLTSRLDMLREFCQTDGRIRWKFELPGERPADWVKSVALAIRSVCPNAEIGIKIHPARLPRPGKQGTGIPSWLQMADFFTFESDPNLSAADAFFEESIQRNYHKNSLMNLREWLKTQGVSVPIYLTGWNTLTGRSIAEAGEFHRSALIVDTILSLRGEVAGITFPLNLHQMEPVQPELPTYSLSLFLYRDIRRPMFFVLRSLCGLGSEVLHEEDGILVTRRGEDDYALLLWHPCYINPFESLNNMRQDDYKKDVQLTLQQLRPGRYRMKNLYQNRDNGSIYSSWMRVGILSPVDQDVLDCMRHFSNPLASLDEEDVDDQISIHQPLSLNSVALWRIWRVSDEGKKRDG